MHRQGHVGYGALARLYRPTACSPFVISLDIAKGWDPRRLDHGKQPTPTTDRTRYRMKFLEGRGAAVAEWLSSWLAEQEDRGSIPGLAT